MDVRVETVREFDKWLAKRDDFEKIRVETRLHRIEESGHFGDFKAVGGKVEELRFASGLRVYFTRILKNGQVCLVLLGGTKDGQQKDIKRAKKLREKYVADS